MSKLKIDSINITKLSELPNAWSPADFDQLKTIFEITDASLSADEQMEYLLMSMAEYEDSELATELLKFKLSDQLTEGQINHLAHEMTTDRMWEEYPDMKFHEAIFNVNQLLYKVYNGKFPKGNAYNLRLNVSTSDKQLQSLILTNNADLILRVIMKGMDEHALLNRLYNDGDLDKILVDAEFILWQIKTEQVSDTQSNIQIISSSYWLEDYTQKEAYEVTLDMDIYE